MQALTQLAADNDIYLIVEVFGWDGHFSMNPAPGHTDPATSMWAWWSWSDWNDNTGPYHVNTEMIAGGINQDVCHRHAIAAVLEPWLTGANTDRVIGVTMLWEALSAHQFLPDNPPGHWEGQLWQWWISMANLLTQVCAEEGWGDVLNRLYHTNEISEYYPGFPGTSGSDAVGIEDYAGEANSYRYNSPVDQYGTIADKAREAFAWVAGYAQPVISMEAATHNWHRRESGVYDPDPQALPPTPDCNACVH